MSGSPTLPPKTIQEAGGHGQAQGSYQNPSQQDVYRGSSTATTQADIRGQQPVPAPPIHTYPPEPPDRITYYPRPEEPMHRSIPYPGQGGSVLHQQPYMPLQGPPQTSTAFPVTSRPPATESQPYMSPKSQRKTKGHVASACVPCKKAHLRCDAQRPCSRCTSNGKEDSCVDVQHKKRGRPRLRDDREPRYDPSRYPHPSDAAMRRPIGIYSSGGAIGSGYEDTLRRSSYRVLKSQPSESMAPRYPERASASDANVLSGPLSIATRPVEPVAFLTMEFEIVKASSVFSDAIGGVSPLKGQKLLDILVPSERDKTLGHQRQMYEDQARREPNYLPPIYSKEEEEKSIQPLGCGPDDISRFHLDRPDYFTFNSAEGPRTCPVRMGLAKEGSIYFVVLLLTLPPPLPYPSPSPHARETGYSYQPPPPARQQQAFTQHTPVSATFDPGRQQFSEGTLAPRQASAPSSQLISGLSPGISPGMPSYSPSPSRPDYPVGPTGYQIPRSELPPATRPPQLPNYQLPPIRAQPQPGAPVTDSAWQRDDRPARVDIGGLLDRSNPDRQSQ